jgi:hypothetical protein
VKEDLTQFMPGLYWDNAVRDTLAKEASLCKPADKLPLKTRGVNARDLADCISDLDNSFLKAEESFFNGDGYIWPTFKVPVRFDIVSPGQALARGKWETCGAIHGEDHNQSCAPTCIKGSKTICSIPESKRNITDPFPVFDGDVIRSGSYGKIPDQYETVPYDKLFGELLQQESEDFRANESVITPSGEMFIEWFMRNGSSGE